MSKLVVLPERLPLTQLGNFTTQHMNDLLSPAICYSTDNPSLYVQLPPASDPKTKVVRFHQFMDANGVLSLIIIREDSRKIHTGIQLPPGHSTISAPIVVEVEGVKYLEVPIGKQRVSLVMVQIWQGDPEHGPTGTVKVGGGG